MSVVGSSGDGGRIDQETRRSRSRTTAFSRDRPTDWRPGDVRTPGGVLDTHFTDSTAWEFIASRLESGDEGEIIELQKPKGAKGYVMKIDVEPDIPALYVKLQLGSGTIIGRSFHYSERGQKED